MNRLKLMQKRRSIRDYKDKSLLSEDDKIVDSYINSVPQIVADSTVSLRKMLDGEKCYQALDGHAGYNGVMIKAPHYVLVTSTAGEHALKAGGYAGEWLVLQLTRHNIGTCWITANHAEKHIAECYGLPSGEEVVGLIAYGYPENESQISNIYKDRLGGGASLASTGYPNIESEYKESNLSSRKSIEDIAFISKFGKRATVERLEELGYDDVFYYMRLAPSSVNRQPWRFVISRGNFVLSVSRDDGYDSDRLAKLEAGIAMLYFEVAMHDSGYPGSWSFEVPDVSLGIPEDYLIAGIYKFID